MTEREKIDLRDYIGEKFADLNRRLDGFDKRLNDLERDRVTRDSELSTFALIAKVFAAGVATFGAAVGAFLGLKNNL